MEILDTVISHLEPIGKYLATLAAGGLLGALFTAWKAGKEQQAARRAEYLSQQLKHLYGPIHFLCGQNVSAFDQWKKLNTGYDQEYVKKQYSTTIGGGVEGETTKTIEVQNRYNTLSNENNNRIVEIMYSNYALIELDDDQAFREFALHNARLRLEYPDGKWDVPIRLLPYVGHIVTFTPDFANLIARRFEEKSRALSKLRGEA